MSGAKQRLREEQNAGAAPSRDTGASGGNEECGGKEGSGRQAAAGTQPRRPGRRATASGRPMAADCDAPKGACFFLGERRRRRAALCGQATDRSHATVHDNRLACLKEWARRSLGEGRK